MTKPRASDDIFQRRRAPARRRWHRVTAAAAVLALPLAASGLIAWPAAAASHAVAAHISAMRADSSSGILPPIGG
jgi:hypothetical protein